MKKIDLTYLDSHHPSLHSELLDPPCISVLSKEINVYSMLNCCIFYLCRPSNGSVTLWS